VVGGNSSNGTITLSKKASGQGSTVTLTSSNVSVTVPSSVTVGTGATTAKFTVTTTPVTVNTSAKITGKLGSSSATATLTVTGPKLTAFTLSPTTLTGGNPSTGTVTISSAAPRGGLSIELSSSNAAWGGPPSITISTGATSGNFVCATKGVQSKTTAKLTAKLGSVSKTASLTLNPAIIQTLSISPITVAGGQNATATVTLNGYAPLGGSKIAVSCSQPSVTVPKTVTIPYGIAQTQFTINTGVVTNPTTAMVTGLLGGVKTSGTLSIVPVRLYSFSIDPTSILGGTTAVGLLSLSDTAQTNMTISLKSNNSAASVPPYVTIPVGQASATFTISTTAVATQVSAQITATLGTSSIGVNLTIAPASLVGFTISPTSVIGGQSAQGTLTLNGAAPTDGTPITLGSSGGAVSVPSTVTVAAGQNTVVFTATSIAVGQPVTATINAEDPYGNQLSATLALSATQTIIVPVQTNAIVYDRVSGNLWATVQQSDPHYSNDVVAINPQTGVIGKKISIGAEPNHISVTSDGSFAYVDVPSTGAILRVDLNAGSVAASYSLNATNLFDLEAVPGSPHAFLTCTDPVGGVNTRVYDDGVARSGTGAGGQYIVFGGDGSTIYGNGQTSLFYDTLSTSAITWTNQVTFNIGARMVFANGVLVTSNCQVIDPIKQSVVQTLTSPNFLSSLGVTASTADNRFYFVSWDVPHTKRILCFDMETYQEYAMTDTGILVGGANNLTACDNHTVAFFTYGSGVTHNVVLVHGLN